MYRLKIFAVQWLAVIAVLMACNLVYHAYFNTYTAADLEYAHTYAAETLALSEEMAAKGEALAARSPQAAGEYFLDGERIFSELKYAAVHLKGRQAEDFVYVFVLLEEWCRLSAEAAGRPEDADTRLRAACYLSTAQSELKFIRTKQYGSINW